MVALTILQRRLASSPEAIAQSLRRRRERHEKRLRELEFLQPARRGLGEGGRGAVVSVRAASTATLDPKDAESVERLIDEELALAPRNQWRR